jgi:hypothetical protein
MLSRDGLFSNGQCLIGNISSDLCIPMGLVLPDFREYLIQPNDESDSCTYNNSCVTDEKIDDFVNRVSYTKYKKKRSLKHHRPSDGKANTYRRRKRIQ